MPVVHIRASLTANERVKTALAAVAEASAAALDGEPAHTWVTYTQLDCQTIGAEVQPIDGGIVYVDVWLRTRGETTDRACFRAICLAAAEALGLPIEDVWGTLRLVEDGFVFAGGGIISE